MIEAHGILIQILIILLNMPFCNKSVLVGDINLYFGAYLVSIDTKKIFIIIKMSNFFLFYAHVLQ